MRSWVRKPLGMVLVAIAIATTGTAIVVNRGTTPPPAAGSANVFVVTGTCDSTPTRQTPAVAFASAPADAKACTVDQAWDVASAGDLICVRPGTYGGQLITGNKVSSTIVRGCDGGVTFTGDPFDPNTACPNAPGVDLFQTGIMCITSNFLTLEDVTIDQADDIRTATGIGQANGADITFNDVNFHGQRPSFQAQGDRFHWNGGEIGATGEAAGQRWCGDGNPMTLNGDNSTIENLTIWPQGSDQTPYTSNPCGGATSTNGFHLENIRMEGVAGGTVRNIDFKTGSEAGSGHIFFSGAATGAMTIEGNFFGQMADGTTSYQINATVPTCNWTWRYNTLMQGNDTPCTDSSSVWVGNLGAVGCSGTHTKNVQQRGSACGTDTIVTGTAGATENLDINSDGSLQSDAEAIDAGEATCSTVNPGLLGTTRPFGSFCDAGAFEYTG